MLDATGTTHGDIWFIADPVRLPVEKDVEVLCDGPRHQGDRFAGASIAAEAATTSCGGWPVT
jgi:hypothetical protein